MDGSENSPLLRVFDRKEKPLASSSNVSASRLARKKGKGAEIQKSLKILQPLIIAEHKDSKISSCYNAVCENDLTIRYSVENLKTITPEINSFSECKDSSYLLNCGKIKPESVDYGSNLSEKEVSLINLSSDADNNSSSDAPPTPRIELSPELQAQATSKEPLDMRHVHHNGSSGGSMDDVCEILEKLEVTDDLPSKNSACDILCTLEKKQPRPFVPSTTKKLQVLQSFFSSDEDCSPPPLSKRLWQEKQIDRPSTECIEKDLSLGKIKKKTSSSLEYVKKDVTPPTHGSIKRNAIPVSDAHNKNKGVSPWNDVRRKESEVSSNEESSNGLNSDEESESSGSEDFEQFLVQLKTPLKTETRSPRIKRVERTRNFIETDKTAKKEITNVASIPPLPKSKVGRRVLSNQPCDIYPDYLDTKNKEKTAFYNSDDSSNNTSSESSDTRVKKISSEKASFLASLSADVPESLANPAALVYRKQFTKKKEELVKKLFALFNYKVFNDKLPKDMKVAWNTNLTKTAGKCFSKRDVALGRVSWIELAPKIIDSADRVRDTLAHELCHAACWLIHGNRGGHGSLWKFWASRVHQMFPEIPPVTRCHRYKINTKYVYVCTGCGGRIGRHSKSIDIAKHVCSRCKSTFELIVNGKTPKTSSKPATGFALFVKENYGSLKKQYPGLKHGDIMKMLSAEFSLKSRLGD